MSEWMSVFLTSARFGGPERSWRSSYRYEDCHWTEMNAAPADNYSPDTDTR